MKSYLTKLVSILTILLLINSCNTLKKLTEFNLDFTDTIKIPSTLGINLPFNLWTPPVKTNSSNIFEINDTKKNLVEEIRIEDLKLSIISPENEDFSFLKSIEIYIAADSLPEILVAWKYNIDDSSDSSINLELSTEDLTTYIIQDEIQLKTTTVTDKLLFTDVDIKVDARFFVNAKILGI